MSQTTHQTPASADETIADARRLAPIAGITLLAGSYLLWQLVGLRFTNHDDLYLHLISWKLAGQYWPLAESVAFTQARIQAYINMPIALWAAYFQNSRVLDVLNLGAFASLYIAFTWSLRTLLGLREAMGLSAATMLLFPLHYYFTFPQGFPMMAAWPLTAALVAAGLLGSSIRRPRMWKTAASAVIFSCSLWGPEYNFILHPIVLLAVLLAASETSADLGPHARRTWLHAIGWIVSVAAYLAFSTLARSSGADSDGRLSLGFDVVAWLRTFAALEARAFLPVSLVDGVRLVTPGVHGGPQIPAILSYQTLWRGAHDLLSIAGVLCLAFMVFSFLLWNQALRFKSVRIALVLLTAIAVVPCAVTAGSLHYQRLVLGGRLQGHLASFYASLGVSALVFVFCACLCNVSRRRLTRAATVLLISAVLAGATATTFVYNNTNRQAMMANAQKWAAMDSLAEFLYERRPDLRRKDLVAPDWWAPTAVSTIPTTGPLGSVSYWSDYSRHVLHKPLRIRKTGEAAGDEVSVRHFPTPQGSPVVVISEVIHGGGVRRSTLVASAPVAGRLAFPYARRASLEVRRDDWTCSPRCALEVEAPMPVEADAVRFQPEDKGPRRLLAQFILPRYLEYAQPLADWPVWDSGARPAGIQVDAWGPRQTAVNVVPNPQPGGSAGLWFKVSGGGSLVGTQVYFDGQPARLTMPGAGMITAAVSPDAFRSPGTKKIQLADSLTRSTLDVGEFVVSP